MNCFTTLGYANKEGCSSYITILYVCARCESGRQHRRPPPKPQDKPQPQPRPQVVCLPAATCCGGCRRGKKKKHVAGPMTPAQQYMTFLQAYAFAIAFNMGAEPPPQEQDGQRSCSMESEKNRGCFICPSDAVTDPQEINK